MQWGMKTNLGRSPDLTASTQWVAAPSCLSFANIILLTIEFTPSLYRVNTAPLCPEPGQGSIVKISPLMITIDPSVALNSLLRVWSKQIQTDSREKASVSPASAALWLGSSNLHDYLSGGSEIGFAAETTREGARALNCFFFFVSKSWKTIGWMWVTRRRS